MRKRALIIVLCILTAGMVSGCGENAARYGTKDKAKISIVCTVFPVYDWVRNIVGNENGNVEIKLLMKGGDLHSFQPSARDIADAVTADMFIYIGGTSDRWADDVVKNNRTEDKAIRLFDILGDSLEGEQHKEGMEPEEHHGHEEHEEEYDEHVWLSLKRASKTVRALTERLCSIDGANSAEYMRNSASYINKIDELDREYAAAAAQSRNKTVIFADRFPFLYMTEDYGIDYYAAFPGCSADAEASFGTVVFLADKADKLGKNTLIVLEGSKQSIADAVISNAKHRNIKTAVMDSCQSTDSSDAADGADYLEIMRGNLVSLKEALN